MDCSKAFVDMLSNKALPPGFSLVSFDVVSLFTKVPLDLTINLILKKIYDDRCQHENLLSANEESFIDLHERYAF